MNFFLDANMSRRLASILAAYCADEHKIIHITEHELFLKNNVYSQNGSLIGNSTSDIEYITALRDSGIAWKIISGESDIVDTAHERAALLEARLTFFSMDHHWGKSTFHEQAWKLVKVWAEIVKCAEGPEPVLYRVSMGRSVCVERIKTGMRARGGKFRG